MDDVTLLVVAAGGLGLSLPGMLIVTDGLPTRIVTDIASGQLTVPESTDRIEALRRRVRISHHLARITHHLERTTHAAGKEAARSPDRQRLYFIRLPARLGAVE